MAFRILPPSIADSPVVVEVPHAGLLLDPESLGLCVAPARSIGRDADLLVDELFVQAPQMGATLVVAELSRYVVDLNRSEDDYDGLTCVRGPKTTSPHGVVWRRTTEGRPAILAPLATEEIERRLRLFYRPYHEALTNLLAEKRSRFGYALLLCAHSMPSAGRLGEVRADWVPGTRGKSTAARQVIEVLENLARERGYSLAHDQPYSGGYSTSHYGQPAGGCHAIQLELSRKLYMDEQNLARRAQSFEQLQESCTELVRRLVQLPPPPPICMADEELRF